MKDGLTKGEGLRVRRGNEKKEGWMERRVEGGNHPVDLSSEMSEASVDCSSAGQNVTDF